MPTYEYKCSKCGFQFEELQSMNDKPLSECPKCGGKVQRLISSGTGMIFKGSGFYLTDYKKSNASPSNSQGSSKTSKPGEPPIKPEAAPAAKKESSTKKETQTK